MNESAIRFLDKVFKDLYKEYSVRRYKKDKISNIDEYMKKFEKFLKSCTEGKRKDYIIRILTDNYVIKEENIPYNRDKAQVISDQRDSLSVWINYLIDDTCSYPMWIKYWVFRSLINIGTYDEVSNTWQKRNEKTLSPFIDFNAEALASTVSAIMQSVNKEKLNDEADINDEEVEKLVQTGSFKRLYTHFLVKVSKQAKKYGNEGRWIKYNQGTDDYIKLSNSLQGYNTGWCTANEEMAKKQICGSYSDAPNGGDFYVYYSVDENGEHKIPRIAIRMSGSDKIGEIRGIASGQNLEEGLEDILETKLKEMSLWTEDVIEKVNANKLISNIIKKHLGHQILEIDEIKVIYELTKLPSFGYEIDPRLEKIRKQRNAQIDFDKLDEESQLLWLVLGKFKVVCNSKKIIIEAVKHYYRNLNYASEELKNDREVVLEAVKQNGEALEYASELLRADKEIVLLAVKTSGSVLRNASEDLKNDREVVLEAVKTNGDVLRYVSEELKNDREFMLEIVKQNGYALSYASEDLKKDRKIVLEAVKQNGLTLSYASEELKSDREVVLEAVNQDGRALCYASEELKNDREVVLEAVNQDGRALCYASEELKNDREFILEVVKEDGSALQFANEELKNDREFMLKAVKQNGGALEYASEELRVDREIVLEAVKEYGNTLAYASEELQNDREIVLEAVKQNGYALSYASEDLKKDRKIVLEAVKEYGNTLAYASEELQNDREIVLEAVKQDGGALEYASEELRGDREIVLEAVKQYGYALIYASEELKNDKEVVLEAVKQDGWALHYASEKIRKDKIFLLTLILYELTNLIKVKFTYISDKVINVCKKFVLKKENIDELEQQNGRHI